MESVSKKEAVGSTTCQQPEHKNSYQPNGSKLEESKQALLPAGFYFEDGLLMYQDSQSRPIPISNEIHVLAYVRDDHNGNHGLLVQFDDIDGYTHQYAIPLRELGSYEYQNDLRSFGLIVYPKAKTLMTQFLLSSAPEPRVRCVTQTGWHKEAFVLPKETIGMTGNERVILQTRLCHTAHTCHTTMYQESGSLEDWQENVAHYCIGNSRLAFACCIALTAPVLHLIGVEGGGFHLRGSSSIGKTTVTNVAASVWSHQGDIQSWRATNNGIEAIATLHNDALLCLDEIGQAEPKEIGQTTYMLANGQGKNRALKTGGLRPSSSWRLLFLSNGEKSLRQFLASGGIRVKGGMEVRMIDLPADTGQFGIFEDLHGHPDGAAFSKFLMQQTAQFYGVAAKTFIRKLLEDKENILEEIKRIQHQAMKDYLSAQVCGQLERVLSRMVLVGSVGEIASHLGVTGWPEEESLRAMNMCIQDYLKSRGDIKPHEESDLLSQVRIFFELHGESRFSLWDTSKDERFVTRDRAGFRKIEHNHLCDEETTTTYYVFREVFKTEICKGYDSTFAHTVLLEAGILIPDSVGKPTRPERLPGIGTKRCYVISMNVFQKSDE